MKNFVEIKKRSRFAMFQTKNSIENRTCEFFLCLQKPNRLSNLTVCLIPTAVIKCSWSNMGGDSLSLLTLLQLKLQTKMTKNVILSVKHSSACTPQKAAVSADRQRKTAEHHLGIYGESQPKGGQLYSCNSGFTPTGAVVFVNFFSMKPEKFCSKGNDYPRTSTYAGNTGYKSLTLLHYLFNKAPP